MRLFTAIELPSSVLFRLERLMSALRPEALVKWSPLDNLHITTKFIGEWPEGRFEELSTALSALHHAPFAVELGTLDWFPNERHPNVLYVSVNGGPALRDLACRTGECLARLGIPVESREYAPHMTLARLRNPVPLQRLRRRVAQLGRAELGKFTVESFTLFRSDPGSNASVYRRLREYPLEAAAMAAS